MPDHAASAGVVGGQLVVTITSRVPATGRFSTLEGGSAGFRAVARPVPTGRYTPVLRSRAQAPPEALQEQ